MASVFLPTSGRFANRPLIEATALCGCWADSVASGRFANRPLIEAHRIHGLSYEFGGPGGLQTAPSLKQPIRSPVEAF